MEATSAHARRWKALLAEYSAAENEHVDLLSSSTEPFSVGQKAQFMGSTARRKALLQKAQTFARGRPFPPLNHMNIFEGAEAYA
jgi:hypothetical protein